MPATVTLTVIRGPLDGKEFVYDQRSICILGRADDCDPRLPDDDAHRTVSRHHCLIDINPPDVRIRDFGSLNGTHVNETKIGQREAHQTPEEVAAVAFPEHDLNDGDEIRLGDTVLRVGIRIAPAAPDQHDAPRTRQLPRCAKCNHEVGSDVGARDGDYLCTACQADPEAIVKHLLELARSGQRDVAAMHDYTLLRELGRGGMGAVYLARHNTTGDQVALKVMLPQVAANTEAKARFLREVELTKALRHPHIATLYDAGSSGGTFFFTIEYCPGGSLDQLIARHGGKLPVGTAIPLAMQALDGLEHAHRQGIVHRDLSPHNILLTGEETPAAKLCDFGLAKAFDQAGLSGLTRTGAAAGKPYFMPRQQVVNFRNAQPDVDVWALAACLYHMLTGTYPRDFPSHKDPWQVVLQNAAVPIRRREPGLPRGLAEAIDQALRERPTIGFPTAAEFRRALLRGL